ncbi:MAG: 3'(2'),5'-bisphosphate nucleotidase CysQ [Gammaproteobacteria bacterium]|nr:3'(2'),5'-bisphosphate nucleotidase CysQ [Gammaproteobacteria bacterium]
MIDELVRISNLASREILDVYNSEFTVHRKSDESPVTQADLRAHDVIVRELTLLDPSIPILSEEERIPGPRVRRKWKQYWLVDPLDGTRDFIDRNGEFTVNIALIEDGKPNLGVVNVPTEEIVYSGDCVGHKAIVQSTETRRTIVSREVDLSALVLLESRHNTTPNNDRFTEHLVQSGRKVMRENVGSSWKICRIAEGSADFYLRCGPTSEWDLAAAHAVLRAAGGHLRLLSGAPLHYNQKESLLNPSFFACGDSPDFWATELNAALSSVGEVGD